MSDILLVSDVKDWAFDVTWKGLEPYLDFDVLYTSDKPTVTPKRVKRYRRTHFFNWLGGQSFAHMKGVSGGVCQHNVQMKWGRQGKKYLPKYEKVVAISEELVELTKKYNPETFYIPNGTDPEKFQPSINKGTFTVGWMGQKTTGGFGEKRSSEDKPVWDIKGYELLLQPLMKRMEKKVKFKVLCANHSNAISREEIYKWYDDIDVFLCTSIYEGGPLPALDAGACGKPIISTPVGIVPQLVRDGINGYLVPKLSSRGDIENILNQIEMLIYKFQNNRKFCRSMGDNNRRIIEEQWTWEKIAPLWRDFFED